MLLSSRAFGPLLLGACLYALLLVCWQAFWSRHLPDPPNHYDMERGAIVWMGKRIGPYYSKHDLQSADVLIIGDSRVKNAILAGQLERKGLGRTAVLWGGGAQLTQMLPALRSFTCRRVVVALSPLSVFTATDPLIGEILRNPVPDISPPDFEAKLRQWLSSERAHLLQAGYTAAKIDSRLADWEGMLRERARPWARRIDHRLEQWVDALRLSLLRTLQPKHWHTSWFYPIDPKASNESYDYRMRSQTHAARSANLGRIADLLRELSSAGKQVVALRLPLSRELLAIEEAGFPSPEFARLCEHAGIPFLDYSRAQYTTRDGSHLTGSSAMRFSRELASDLLELWN